MAYVKEAMKFRGRPGLSFLQLQTHRFTTVFYIPSQPRRSCICGVLGILVTNFPHERIVGENSPGRQRSHSVDLNETFDGAPMPEHAGYHCHEEGAAQEVSHTPNRHSLI